MILSPHNPTEFSLAIFCIDQLAWSANIRNEQYTCTSKATTSLKLPLIQNTKLFPVKSLQ